MIISLLSTKCIIEIKIRWLESFEINDVMGLSPNHVFSPINGNNYYISMNLKFFVNAIK